MSNSSGAIRAAFTCLRALTFALVAVGASARTDDDTANARQAAANGSLRAASGAGAMALRGTIVSTDAHKSEAFVDFGNGIQQRIRIGATLQNWGEVVAIQRQQILIRRGGAIFEFSFNDSAPMGVETSDRQAFINQRAASYENAEGSGNEVVDDNSLYTETAEQQHAEEQAQLDFQNSLWQGGSVPEPVPDSPRPRGRRRQ